MRRFFLFFVFMLTLSQVNAIAQDTGDTKPIWGIKAAFDINIPGKWHANGGSVKMYEHGFGGTVGALCNIYLVHDFYLEPGVSFFYDTYSCGDITLVGSDYSRFTIHPTIYKMGLRVPVVAGYTFDITDRFMMSVYTGPEMSYVIKGGIRGEYKNPDEKDLVESFNPYGKYGLHRKLDCAWKIGLAFPTDYVTLTVDAAIGITDICKNDISMRENRFSIGLAHYF